MRAKPYLIMMGVRIVLGGVLTIAVGYSGQLDTPVAAINVGISAPLIVERARGTRDSAVSDSEAVEDAPASHVDRSGAANEASVERDKEPNVSKLPGVEEGER